MTPASKFMLVVLIAMVVFAAACTAHPRAQVVSVERLIGHRVETRDGYLAGELEKVLLSPREGQVQYGVIQLVPGPFHTSKMITLKNPPKVAVPWKVFTIADNGSYLVVDASISQLWQAPEFISKQSVDQPDWDETIQLYWSTSSSGPE